jgi:hypothetical protein
LEMQGDSGKMQGSASREPSKKHDFSTRWITFSLTQRAGKQFRKAGRHDRRSNETVPAASICGSSRVDGRTVTYGCERSLPNRSSKRWVFGIEVADPIRPATGRPGSENSRWRGRCAGAVCRNIVSPTAWYDCYGLSPGRPTLSTNARAAGEKSS